MLLENDDRGPAHLTYCLNIHRTESAADLRAALVIAASIARRFGTAPFAAGLRLSDLGVKEATSAATCSDAIRADLDTHALLPITFNAFAQGSFAADAVKRDVYRPNWTEPERLRYTVDVANLLADWLPRGTRHATISTAPLGWRTEVQGREDVAARQLVALAAELARLQEDTGLAITVCLEPEPGCILQSTPEAIAFFTTRLWPCAAQTTRLFGANAPEVVRRHIGLCYDTCHQAVLFEDPRSSLDALASAGIVIGKMQLSSALRLPYQQAAELDALLAWDEPRFLHQSVVRGDDGRLLAFDDLPDLRAARARGELPSQGEVRCHFHVPIHAAAMPPLATTRDDLIAAATHARARDLTRQFEVETYTFDVLPPPLRAAGVLAQIEAELRFARAMLTGSQPA